MVPFPLASDPACNPECRACHYKHLDYPEQLARKQRWAEARLARWAHALAPIVPAPKSERLGYRFKTWLRSSARRDGLSFGLSFGMFRSRQTAGGRWEKEFVSWDTCPLHAEPIREMITRLRRVLSENAAAFTETALAGVWLGSPHLVIVAREDAPDALAAVDWSRVLVAPFDRVWFHANSQVGAKVFGHRSLVQLAGPPPDSAHPVRAFRQTAHTLLGSARALALAHLLDSSPAPPAQVLDLYCGTGELSLGLPADVEWIGIEQAKDAVEFAASLRKPGRGVHRAFVGAVEQRLADPAVLRLLRPPYALYLNPPRSGLTPEARAQVMNLLRLHPAGSIAYLSCSASSLGRDLVALEEAGYRVEALRPFDFFPQTEHFETLATLTPIA